MTRATTPAHVEHVIANWNAGIGPDALHDALGWTTAELERYQSTGELPTPDRVLGFSMPEGARVRFLDEPEHNPFLEGTIREAPTTRLHGLKPLAESVAQHEPTLEEISAACRPGPLHTRPQTAWWEFYTRWHAKPTGDGQWKVLGEHGEEDTDGPRRHDDNATAQKRADVLNSAEQAQARATATKGHA